jgi:hypothetical protein
MGLGPAGVFCMHAGAVACDDRPRGASPRRIPALNSSGRSKRPGFLNRGLEFGFANSSPGDAGKRVGQAFPPDRADSSGGNA